MPLGDRKQTYNVICEPQDEGGFSGQCVELPAAISQGKTMEELEANMREAIELVLRHNAKSTESKQVIQITA